MFYRDDCSPSTSVAHRNDVSLTHLMELQQVRGTPDEDDNHGDSDSNISAVDLHLNSDMPDPDLSTGTPSATPNNEIDADNDLSFSTPVPVPAVEFPAPSGALSSDDDVSRLVPDEEANWHTVTSKGRRIRKPSRYCEEAATALESNFFSVLSDDDDSDYDDLWYAIVPSSNDRHHSPEVAAVGAGMLHKDITHTDSLKVMTYKQAMATGQTEEWDNAMLEEYMRFAKHEALRAVPKSDVPASAKNFSTVWAMKKKANGRYRARLNMRGFEQVPHVHYDPAWTSAPVACAMTIRIMLVLYLMTCSWYAHIVDVMGAFLLDFFQKGEKIYTPIPLGWESFFPPNVLLLLLRTIYGLKQAANCFYVLLVKTMRSLSFSRSPADPALFYKWHETKGLMVWLSWTDDLICFGNQEEVLQEVDSIKGKFEVDDVGRLTDYLGCTITVTPDKDPAKSAGITLTQSVLIQTLIDSYYHEGTTSSTPACCGAALQPSAEGEEVGAEGSAEYQTIVGKLLHLANWTRPDVVNAVREASRRCKNSNKKHRQFADKIISYILSTPKRGWHLKPTRRWKPTDKDFEFVIRGRPDSNYGTDQETRKSVSGYVVYLEDAPISIKSIMQRIIALSSTEAELIALVQCVQEMMAAKRLLESMDLKLKLPMLIECDNKGAVDLVNGYQVGAGTKHIDIRNFFVRVLKDEGIIVVRWIPTDENESDICTKNAKKATYLKHVKH